MTFCYSIKVESWEIEMTIQNLTQPKDKLIMGHKGAFRLDGLSGR